MKTFIHTHVTVDYTSTPVILAIETRFAQYYKVFEMMSDSYVPYSPVVFE